MFKILVADDDRNTRRLMQAVLSHAGYEVLTASDGVEAFDALDKNHIDLIVLDVMMPRMDGWEFTENMRKAGNNTPILMVTAKQTADDVIKGFRTGTDDYMVKPVNEEELLLRIKAILRRSQIASEKKITAGKATLDYSSLSVSRDGERETLPKKEFYLLYALLSYPGRIFTRLQLMDEIWGMETNSAEKTVDVHINRLRKRFGEWDDFKIIAVRGIGYKAEINGDKK